MPYNKNARPRILCERGMSTGTLHTKAAHNPHRRSTIHCNMPCTLLPRKPATTRLDGPAPPRLHRRLQRRRHEGEVPLAGSAAEAEPGGGRGIVRLAHLDCEPSQACGGRVGSNTDV